MSKNKFVEYQLDGVIAIPAGSRGVEDKIVNAIIAVVEAMDGQVGGQLLRRLTAKDYAAMEAEMALLLRDKNGKQKSKRRVRKAKV